MIGCNMSIRLTISYFKKLGTLILYCARHISPYIYEIVSIDKCEVAGEYVVTFIHLANKKCFSKNVIDLYNNPKMLNKFDFNDAIKIGNYYAKSLYEKSKFI